MQDRLPLSVLQAVHARRHREQLYKRNPMRVPPGLKLAAAILRATNEPEIRCITAGKMSWHKKPE